MTAASGLTLRLLGDDAVGEAADIIAARLAETPAVVMTLPTGRTFAPIYERWHRPAGNTPRFPDARGVQLDDYIGLAADDPRRFAVVLDQALFARYVFDRNNALFMQPAGGGAAARAVEQAVAAMGGLDLALLGLGSNGHVGFNEPGSSLDSVAREVRLAPSTRAQMAASFADRPPPETGCTLGLATLFAARSVIIVAFGAAKADAVAACVAGAVGPDCPASYFQNHADAALLVDRAAAARLLADC